MVAANVLYLEYEKSSLPQYAPDRQRLRMGDTMGSAAHFADTFELLFQSMTQKCFRPVEARIRKQLLR